MSNNERPVTIELVITGAVSSYLTLPAYAAADALALPMNAGHLWRIRPPDKTGAIPDDEARYAADCAACGVPNVYA